MERRFLGVFILLLLFVSGKCDESSEDASSEVLKDEYGQIFHNLPTLFEYLLEMLQDRPEILEKDDVTFFQDVPQETCEGDEKRKREVEVQCNQPSSSNLSKDKPEVHRRNIINDFSSNDYNIGNVIPKISKNDPNIDSSLPKAAIAKPTSEIKKRKSNEMHKGNTKKIKRNLEINTGKIKNKVIKNINTDESFLGSIDWSKLYLSTEEVEEQTLKAEQAIEEHNRKTKR